MWFKSSSQWKSPQIPIDGAKIDISKRGGYCVLYKRDAECCWMWFLAYLYCCLKMTILKCIHLHVQLLPIFVFSFTCGSLVLSFATHPPPPPHHHHHHHHHMYIYNYIYRERERRMYNAHVYTTHKHTYNVLHAGIGFDAMWLGRQSPNRYLNPTQTPGRVSPMFNSRSTVDFSNGFGWNVREKPPTLYKIWMFKHWLIILLLHWMGIIGVRYIGGISHAQTNSNLQWG